MLLLVCTLALLSCGLAQDYHYPRPHIPFHLSPQPQQPVQEPSKRYIVQTLGPHGRTYELQSHKAPAIYVAHQTVNVPVQQIQQHQQQHLQLQQQYHVQQQQQHLQQQQQYHVQQPLQQLPTSSFQNPLLVNNNYQQLPVSLTAPLPHPATPISYHAQGQIQGQGQVQGQLQLQQQIQSHVQQPVDSYYNAPQALTVATATHVQPANQYGPPSLQLQQQPQQQPHNSNPLPYAIVTLPSGQRVQDAGHGSGPQQSPSQPPRLGDYNAQSPSATLDTYSYKQSVPGDTRSYQRFVTNCQPNGQCHQQTLNPGQIDGDHQQLLNTARAQTQPAATGCKKSVHVPPGAQQNEQGQLRPRGRRTFAHVQEQLAKYPYN